MSARPLILVSNDDGVLARGFVALSKALEPLGDVYGVAPTTEQSANSHSLTLDRPLRLRKLGERVFSVDGTPADSIYVALFHRELLPRRPRIVVSGLNHGPNLGSDVFYSGTVAAAREGALRGVPAIAFSMLGRDRVDECAELARGLVARMLDVTHVSGAQVPLLSVNFPPGEPKGVRATRLGRRTYMDEISVRKDPRGREYMWLGGPGPDPHEHIEGSDTEAVDEGWVSVTPLSIEATFPDHFGVAAWVAGPEKGNGDE